MASYDYEEWYNHYTDSEGNVIQQGTPLDAKHFNHMAKGIYRAGLQQYYFVYGADGYFHVLVDQTEEDEKGLEIGDSTTIGSLEYEGTKHTPQTEYGSTEDESEEDADGEGGSENEENSEEIGGTD